MQSGDQLENKSKNTHKELRQRNFIADTQCWFGVSRVVLCRDRAVSLLIVAGLVQLPS